MRFGEGIEEAIRSGRVPDSQSIAAVVDASAERLGARGVWRSERRLTEQLAGLGPLAPVAAEPGVTDILVNGDGLTWLDRGRGLERVPERDFANPEEVRRFAVRLAGLAGRRLDDSMPWVDGLLPGAIRLHAILPPLASDGTTVSLRLLRRSTVRLEDLERVGMCSPAQSERLRRMVAEREAFVVTGGTGAGKTTLLAALLGEVEKSERILVVEDVLEMPLHAGHVVRLQARPANVEGQGLVTLVDLVRQALRMRPDRLVVGEVRGAEVRELLLALNTGHEGGCCTLHANRPADVPARLEALGALAGMSPAAVRAQVATAIKTVVHVARTPAGRMVTAVEEL
ncbi:MAG TPA: TadA family conjugal transfer-associated ATPase [Tetrasphaera sp.]|uniref:TadA family conjugal transfer-associated ATPase n=1 Tax=Nostocoides vanveenii TaxID=330835 RepID=A0ABN2KN66_9MICO|nr:TadA family conjugal transfer-associated ATPase [Tetrasphaera sp.]HNQ06014.1 TadA family conjugal transfer-associated ATPase [Tetrasphaera sp.]